MVSDPCCLLQTFLQYFRSFKASTKTSILCPCSDHQLRIETGRHQKLEIAQRTCDMCKSGKVENEIHFLIECEAYRDLRQTFLGPNLNKILTATQIEYAFINVLTAQDISRQKNFAQFLQQATELRTKTLTNVQRQNVCP